MTRYNLLIPHTCNRNKDNLIKICISMLYYTNLNMYIQMQHHHNFIYKYVYPRFYCKDKKIYLRKLRVLLRVPRITSKF